MKFFSFLGKCICGIAKFCNKLITIAVIFVCAIVLLTVIMPKNVEIALEIFKNLLKIP